MGLWGFGKKALNSTIGPSMQPLNTVINNYTSSKVAALQAYIDGMSNIKSIQRGTVLIDRYGGGAALATVNPAKCIVLLNGGSVNSYGGFTPILSSLTSTALAISASTIINNVTTTVSWQVIEFY